MITRIDSQKELILFLEELKEKQVILPENLRLQIKSGFLCQSIINDIFNVKDQNIILGTNVGLSKFDYMGVKCSIENE